MQPVVSLRQAGEDVNRTARYASASAAASFDAISPANAACRARGSPATPCRRCWPWARSQSGPGERIPVALPPKRYSGIGERGLLGWTLPCGFHALLRGKDLGIAVERFGHQPAEVERRLRLLCLSRGQRRRREEKQRPGIHNSSPESTCARIRALLGSTRKQSRARRHAGSGGIRWSGRNFADTDRAATRRQRSKTAPPKPLRDVEATNSTALKQLVMRSLSAKAPSAASRHPAMERRNRDVPDCRLFSRNDRGRRSSWRMSRSRADNHRRPTWQSAEAPHTK